MNWHIDATTAARYVERHLDPASTASVDAHLMDCAECRSEVGAAVDRPLLDEVWRGVVDTLDQPRLTLVERMLISVGLSDSSARIVAATSRARWSYLAAVALTVLMAVVAALSPYEEYFGAFLVIAPIGPLVATATSFGRSFDPVRELLATMPTSSLRILLVRTGAAAAPAIVLTAIPALWLVDHGWMAAAWLLPSLALCLAALAVSSWMPIESAASVLGAAWLLLPVVLRLRVTELLEVLGGRVQVASALTVIAALGVTAIRRTTFDYLEA